MKYPTLTDSSDSQRGPSSGPRTVEARPETVSMGWARSDPPSPAGPVVPLLETLYSTIHWDRARSLVRFARTAVPYRTTADIGREGMLVHRALEKAGRARLLVDLRAVAPRNDRAFEVAITAFRRKLFGGAGQMAILVGTAVGVLQVKRHMREDGFRAEVFSDEREALAFFD